MPISEGDLATGGIVTGVAAVVASLGGEGDAYAVAGNVGVGGGDEGLVHREQPGVDGQELGTVGVVVEEDLCVSHGSSVHGCRVHVPARAGDVGVRPRGRVYGVSLTPRQRADAALRKVHPQEGAGRRREDQSARCALRVTAMRSSRPSSASSNSTAEWSSDNGWRSRATVG